MKVLSVASEVFPLIKTGGLADVAGALPGALKVHGVEVKTLLPGYPVVMKRLRRTEPVLTYSDLFGHEAAVLSARSAGLDLLVLDAPALFERDGGPYSDSQGADFPDNWARFAALSKVASDLAGGKLAQWRPDLVHAHDWQGAMAPVYMRYDDRLMPPAMMTIHNLAFQGQFAADIFPELDLPTAAFTMDGIEYYGDVGFLKGGLQSAQAITTVSPTYAQEIRSPEFGMGLEGLINARLNQVHGIVNGIDTDVWNPETDKNLAGAYSLTRLKKRKTNRTALMDRFQLEDTGGPLFSIVSRLTWQKGIDLVTQTIDDLVEMGGMLAVLGSGDKALEGALLAAAARHRGKVNIIIGYDEPLSHLIQAGTDAMLVPSRFEPCGLTQLFALRYGAIPVVSRTGGLADTVIDANEAALAAKVATGVVFSPITTDGLLQAYRRTIDIYRSPKLWASLQKKGMKSDVSWEKSAESYASLYQILIDEA